MSGPVTVQVTGHKAIPRAMQRYMDALGDAYQEGLDDACFRFIDENDEAVPIDTGALRNSGRAYPESGKGFSVIYVLGYGWEIEEIYMRGSEIKIPRKYAAVQDRRHEFLRDGIDTYEGLMLEIIVDRMEQV